MGLSNEAKESILQAMDIIANKATSEIAFDSTIKCVIVNSEHANDGYYTVSNGTTKFTAYSENTLYKENECVRVSIPNNDFSEKKYILGKWAGDDASEPITYTSAANTILEIVNFVDTKNMSIGLEANGSKKTKRIELPNVGSFFEELTDNEIFNVLYLEVSFLTNLEQLKMVSGNYGVRLSIYNKKSAQIGTLILDSSEFFGNPYAFTVPARQSKKLNLSNLDQIGSITLDLYQKNNFKYYNNQNKIVSLNATGKINNIFVKSLKIGFGTDLNLIEDNTVKIFCSDDLSYEFSSKSKEKEIGLLWYNKSKDNTYIGFSDGLARKRISQNKFNEGIEKYNLSSTITSYYYDGGLKNVKNGNDYYTDYSYYDESLYLEKQAAENQLSAQLVENVPTDEASLQFRADTFSTAIPKVKEVYLLITKDLDSLLSSFESRIGTSCDAIKNKFSTARSSVQTIKGKFDNLIQVENKKVYKLISYEKGAILTKEEFDYIKKIEAKDGNQKKWINVTDEKINLNNYFSSTEDETDIVVKKDIRVIIVKTMKVNPIEQQTINLLSYGAECEKYNKGNGDGVYPLFSSFKDYADCFIAETLFNGNGLITFDTVSKLLKKNLTDENAKDGIYDIINTCITEIDKLVIGDSASYKSFSGIWSGQKEKLIEIQRKIEEEFNNPIILKLPISLTYQGPDSSDSSKGIIKIKTYEAGENEYDIIYSRNDAWDKVSWESQFDVTDFDNLYSIYLYQYSPGYEDSNDKIISKNWKLISKILESSKKRIGNKNFGLPNKNTTGKNIEYWNKNFTGQNIPKFKVTLDSSLTEEKFKVIIVFNHNQYESDELVFSNVDKIVNLNITDKELSGFQIINGTNSKDNYQEHYNFTNQLISSSDSQVERVVIAKFKDEKEENQKEIFENSWIYWYVPDGATMIKYDFDKLISSSDNYGFYTDKEKTVQKKNGYSPSYYEYQMVQGSTLTAGSKIIIYGEKDIKTIVKNGDTETEVTTKYYCIDTEKSYYIKAEEVDFENDKKLFYSKAFISPSYVELENLTSQNYEKGKYYYIKDETYTLDNSDSFTSNRIYYEKIEEEKNYFYVTDSALEFELGEKGKLEVSELEERYPDLQIKFKDRSGASYVAFSTLFDENENFITDNNYFSLSDGFYIAKENLQLKCTGIKKGGSSDTYGNGPFFLNSDTETKTILLLAGNHANKNKDQKKVSSVKVYPTSNSNKFMLASDLEKNTDYKKIGYVKEYKEISLTNSTYVKDTYYYINDNNEYVKDTSDTRASGRQYYEKIVVKRFIYKIASNGTSANSLEVIESEFYDPLTKDTYYKKYKQEKFIKKSSYNEIKPYYSRDGYYCFYKQITDYDRDRKFYYYIKNNFSQDATNNIIQCAIEGERWTIDETLVSKEFLFGTYGANGTEYSIQVTPKREKIKKENDSSAMLYTTLAINLYNGQGEQLDFSEPMLSWEGPTSCLISDIKKDYDGKGYLVEIRERIGEPTNITNDTYAINEYYAVLKIMIGLEDISLESFYPIPYTVSSDYYIDGATTVVYDSMGTAASYCLDPYKIYKKKDNISGSLDDIEEETEKITWGIQYVQGSAGEPGTVLTKPTATNINDGRITKFLPTIDTKKKVLIPLNMFVDNSGGYASVVCKKDNSVIWIQPIAILQNRFGSTTLNKWNGKFKMDEDNGTIFGSMFGAGKKNDDNSFSGVLMGDVKAKGGFSVNEIQTGIYGFHEGAASFGFNTNGTAFLGKTGKGRITFDGNNGYIASAQWDGTFNFEGVAKTGSKGMLIDLNNGHIDAHDFKLTSGNIKLDSNPDLGGNWIDIGNDDTYLRFSNEGNLDIRVTNFELTYHEGENLLINTAPLENDGEIMRYGDGQKQWLYNYNTTNVDDLATAKTANGTSIYEELKKDAVISSTKLKTIYFIKQAKTVSNYESLFINYDNDDDNILKYISPNDEVIRDYIRNQITTDDIFNLNIIIDSTKQSGEIKEVDDITSDALKASDYKIGPLFIKDNEIRNYENLTIGVLEKYIGINKEFTENKGLCKKGFYLIANLSSTDKVLKKDIFDRYFYEDIDNEGNINIKCKEDIFIVTAKDTLSEFLSSSGETTGIVAYPQVFETTSERKCIKIDKTNYTLSQELSTDLKENTNYTLSGKVRVSNTSSSGAIKFKVGNKEEALEGITSNINGWVDINIKFSDVVSENTDRKIFEITDTTNHGNSNKYTLFYHLKLEEGLTATAWCQSTKEQNYADKMKDDAEEESKKYSKQMNATLDSNEIFNRLTESGKRQGFFTDDETGKFIINAECIGTGLLRSNAIEGTFDCRYNNSSGSGTTTKNNVPLSSYDAYSKEFKNRSLQITNINLTNGTLFDLRSGIMSARKFELNAWTDENGGLYLNSHPDTLGYLGEGKRDAWLLIGNNTTYLKFLNSGKLAIKVTDFELTFAQGENLLYNTAPLQESYTEEIQNFDAVTVKTIWTATNSLINTQKDEISTGRLLSYLTKNTHRKCLQLIKYNAAASSTITQELKTNLKEKTNYTLSGKVYVNNTAENGAIKFTVGNKEEFLEGITSSTEGWIDVNIKFSDVVSKNTDKKIFEIIDTTNHGNTNNKYTLFYHLKLEEGLTATSWCQSTREREQSQFYADRAENNAKDYAKNYTDILSNSLYDSNIFDRLFQNGKVQGITTEVAGEDGNERKLYINASVIGSGVLRSNTLNGTFSYKVKNSTVTGSNINLSEYSAISDQYKENLIITKIELNQGTLFNLNDGLFMSSNVNLDFNASGGEYYENLKKLKNVVGNTVNYKLVSKYALSKSVGLAVPDIYTDELLDLDGDGEVTSSDARLFLRAGSGLINQKYNFKLNDSGFRVSSLKEEADNKFVIDKELFRVDASGVSMLNGVRLYSKTSANNNYYFNDSYKYTEADAKYCLALAVGNDTPERFQEFKDEYPSSSVTSTNYHSYYDVDGDGKITSADARLISRWVSKLESSPFFEVSLEDSGLYFYRSNSSGNRETIMSVDYSGVYINELANMNSGLSGSGDISFGYDSPSTAFNGKTPSVGTIYLKIIN